MNDGEVTIKLGSVEEFFDHMRNTAKKLDPRSRTSVPLRHHHRVRGRG